MTISTSLTRTTKALIQKTRLMFWFVKMTVNIIAAFFEEGWFRMILLREDFVFRSGVIAWRELPEPPKF